MLATCSYFCCCKTWNTHTHTHTLIKGSSPSGRSDVIFFGVCSVTTVGFVLMLWKLATFRKGWRQGKTTPTINHSTLSHYSVDLEQSLDDHTHSYQLQQRPILILGESELSWLTITLAYYNACLCVFLLRKWIDHDFCCQNYCLRRRAHGWSLGQFVDILIVDRASCWAVYMSWSSRDLRTQIWTKFVSFLCCGDQGD